MSGAQRTSVGFGRPIQKTDLDSTLSTEIDTRAPQGRTASAITALGAAGSMTLTSDDDQGEVDIDVTLTADGVFTVNGLETTTRAKVWLTAIQDATGNHQLDIKNGATGEQVTVTIDQTPSGRTLLLLKTNDAGQTLQVVDQSTVSSGGGSGSGIPNATITGTPGAPNVLTANPPAIFLPSTLAYQWVTSTDGGTTWTPISGATSQTYTQVSGDAGNKIDCQVSGTPMVTADTPVDVPSTDVAYVATAQQGTTTSTSLHALAPADMEDGDILFCAITVPTGAGVTISTIPATTGGTDWVPMGSGADTSSGGTVVPGRYRDAGSSLVQFLYWKRVAGGDTTATWSFTASGSVSYRSRTISVRNALATGTPFENFAQSFKSSSTSLPFGAPTATNARSLEISVASFPSSLGITWPATDPTFTDVAGSDYQHFGYRFLTAAGTGAAITGTLSAASRASEARWVVIPA